MYILINNNRINIKEAITFKERLNGLMGKTNFDYGILFKKCNAIHTFFMKENIDVIGLDENNIIIYKYENLPKNQILNIKYSSNKTSILELPQGLGKYLNLNEKIEFID